MPIHQNKMFQKRCHCCNKLLQKNPKTKNKTPKNRSLPGYLPVHLMGIPESDLAGSEPQGATFYGLLWSQEALRAPAPNQEQKASPSASVLRVCHLLATKPKA